jgi:formyltetrahydrofolate deformylase
MQHNTAVYLISCPDRKGIVSEVTSFLYRNNGNIISAEQYTDFDERRFFMRIEWELNDFRLSREELSDGAFDPLARKFGMQYRLYFGDDRPVMAIYVTTQDHCLQEILWRYRQQELKCVIGCIISNHEDLRPVAQTFGIPFYHVPKQSPPPAEAEAREFAILQQHRVRLIVLAKYMQVLSDDYVRRYPNRIINIHHSFLPAFEGGRPYHRAHARGVKIIGATVHYVSSELDKGPIIDQTVVRVSHKDTVDDFIRKGRDLEKLLLVRGVALHLDRRILSYNNRTVVFE